MAKSTADKRRQVKYFHNMATELLKEGLIPQSAHFRTLATELEKKI